MNGPTKNLTILSCESFYSAEILKNEFSSFKISKHPGALINILAALKGSTNDEEVRFFDLNSDKEISTDFLHCENSTNQNQNNYELCIKSFKIIEGDWLAILILSDGRIYRAKIDEFLTIDQTIWTFEQVGAVEGGISAAEWSPDYSILVLVTGLNRKILLTRDFEPLEEGPIQVEEYGSEEMISIGWGKKETQFHGTVGKSAAVAFSPIKMTPVSGDNQQARITWRADGNYFAISILDSDAGRRIRVYDINGSLVSTSEPIEGLEESLAWRPNGSIIASTQFIEAQNKRQVIFFEKNGLRHGEFVLPGGNKKLVKNLEWSVDSNVLAVIYQNDEVELWTSSNYHWYLKTKLPVGSVKYANWDSENLIITTISDIVHVFTLVWDQLVSDSCIGVVDGKTIHLTPLNISNIPPPLSLFQLNLSNVPDAVALKSLGQNSFKISVALPDCLEMYQIALNCKKSLCSVQLIEKIEIQERLIQLQSCASGFIGSNLFGSEIILFQENTPVNKIPLLEKCWRLLAESGQVCLSDKTIHKVNEGILDFTGAIENKGEWISFLKNEEMYLVMNEKGWLWAGDNLIMTQATSFAINDQFVLITTHTHQLVFLPRNGKINTWESLARSALDGQNGNEELQRRVERGALLVTAVPEASGVVLQMPRGNLETINPRALILSSLRAFLKTLEYRSAYALCRRHRIDLNILHDHAPELFLQTIGKFVKDLESVDHLNIFLSSLKDEDVSKTKYAGFVTTKISLNDSAAFVGKVNSVSEAILKVLQEDSMTWIDSIMTVFIVQQPSRLEDALKCIIELAASGKSPEVIEKTMKYILFLVPAEKLFDVALGMFELPLALSIARRSQKDPKDFEPFLKELAMLPEMKRNFRINDHLQRYSQALNCLYQDSEVNDDEFLAYMQKYNLYNEAIEISSTNNINNRIRIDHKLLYKNVLNLFGNYLENSKDYLGAVCCYKRSGNWEKLRDVAIISGSWIEFIESANNCQITEDQKISLIKNLKIQGKTKEALQFCRISGISNEISVNFAIENGLFAEAALIQEPNESFHVALNCYGEKLCNRLKELSKDFNEKTERILRIQRNFLAGPPKPTEGQFSGSSGTGDISDNVSEMSFRTSNTTIKTRTTNASFRSNTSTKKTERNRTRDRPGSPHEREFLLFNLKELINQVYKLGPEIKESLKNLVMYNEKDFAMKLPREISSIYQSLIQSTRSFVEEFRRIQVPKICNFNENREAINENGNLIENLVVDPLDAKFELPADFGSPELWSVKLLLLK